MKTIGELLAERAERSGSAPALITSDRTVSYGELARSAESVAAVLGRHLPAGGSRRVAIHVSDKAALCTAFYGTVTHGRSAMIVSDDLAVEQWLALLRKYRPAAVIMDQTRADKFGTQAGESFAGAIFSIDAQGRVACMRESPRGKGADPGGAVLQPPPDEAIVLFTSGTTGSKKAVPISHQNLLWTGRMINRFMGLDAPLAELVTVPLSHAFGLRRIICVHLVGGAVVVEDGPFNPARSLQALRDRRCTGLSAVPAVLGMFRSAFADVLKQIGERIEFVELGSAPLSARGKTDLCELFPKAQLCMHYGLTEASKVTFLHFFRDAHKLHTIGRPSPGVQVKVADEGGVEVPVGGLGEIWAKGLNVAEEYLLDPELTGEKFRDGWFHTGDLARADADGYLELLGRTDDMINVGGKKLYPLEIEQHVKDAFPDIDCAVAAEANAHLGARPVLCYSEATPVSPALFREVAARLAEKVEAYKVPIRAVAVPAIPRTANGKVVRQDLACLINGGTG